MAQNPRNFSSRSSVSGVRKGGITVLRSPAVAHMKALFNKQAFRQYRIKNK